MEADELAELHRKLAALTQRVYLLEQQLRVAAAPAVDTTIPMPAPVAAPVAEAAHKLSPPRPAQIVEPPGFTQLEAPTPSLETRIGSQWLNRVGVIALLFSAAWFLKYAFENQWVGPLGRVAIGLLCGAGLMVWSETFRTRGHRLFSHSLKAIGTGVLYLSLWAASSLFHLVSHPVAFAGMVLVTAANSYMACVQNSEILAAYALLGGLITPALLSSHTNQETALFTYLLLLDTATLGLAVKRGWLGLVAGALAGTALLGMDWSWTFYQPQELLRTSIFVALFVFLFAIAPAWPRPVAMPEQTPEDTSERRRSALQLLISAAAAAGGFLCFYTMLDGTPHAWLEPWVALAFAVFYVALARITVCFGRRAAFPVLLFCIYATGFLTLAITLKAHGAWLAVGWLVEGCGLLYVATRFRQMVTPAVLAGISLSMGWIASWLNNPYWGPHAFWNRRFATNLVAIAAAALAAFLASRVRSGEETSGTVPDEPVNWLAGAAIASVVFNILVLFSILREIHTYWWGSFVWSAGNWMPIHIASQFTYSAWMILYGAVLLGIGFARRIGFLRWQALLLLGASIVKVFLYDMRELSQGYRILSFFALGLVLMVISFAYQRDWLKLRHPLERES